MHITQHPWRPNKALSSLQKEAMHDPIHGLDHRQTQTTTDRTQHTHQIGHRHHTQHRRQWSNTSLETHLRSTGPNTSRPSPVRFSARGRQRPGPDIQREDLNSQSTWDRYYSSDPNRWRGECQSEVQDGKRSAPSAKLPVFSWSLPWPQRRTRSEGTPHKCLSPGWSPKNHQLGFSPHTPTNHARWEAQMRPGPASSSSCRQMVSLFHLAPSIQSGTTSKQSLGPEITFLAILHEQHNRPPTCNTHHRKSATQWVTSRSSTCMPMPTRATAFLRRPHRSLSTGP